MNEKELMKSNPSQLAEMLSQGLADEEQRGMILRTMQTALGMKIVTGMSSLEESMNSLNTLIVNCTSKAVAKINELIEADTMDWSAMLEIATTLQKNQVSFLELQRKIVQSPNKIFGEDLLSSEEKKLLMVLKSFKTQKEKETFLKAVQKAMTESNSFDNQE